MTNPERPEEAPLTAAGLAAPRTAKLSFERVALPSLDRFLPARPAPFVAAALCIAVACWVAGFLLAADKDRFLMTREWQIQPLYLATHLLILRLFVTAYVRNFLEGCGYLTIAPGVAERRIRTVLGPIGIACALALAAWFVWSDCIVYLRSAK